MQMLLNTTIWEPGLCVCVGVGGGGGGGVSVCIAELENKQI